MTHLRMKDVCSKVLWNLCGVCVCVWRGGVGEVCNYSVYLGRWDADSPERIVTVPSLRALGSLL